MDNNAFLLCLTETHLQKNISNSELTNNFWSIIRADRVKRMCGGAAIAYRSSLDIDDENLITFSNDYCEMVCVYFRNINLANITIYRPPGCNKMKFDEVINKAKEWIRNIEILYHNPRVIINGDLNFPFMCDWNGTITDSLCESIEARKLNGKSVNSDKEQALDLYNLTCESFMTQCVNIPTRKQNILDLCFSNDTNLISNVDIIENVIMSDHSTIILETDIEALYGNSNHKEHINIYYTNIPEYETMDASVTEISNMRNYLHELK